MINIGNYFHLYGLMIGLGVLLGISLVELAQKRMQKYCRDYAEINIDKLLPFLIIGALVGARAYHIIDYWEFYSKNLLDIVKLWNGGLGIWGAVLGGVLVLVFYFRKGLKKVVVSLDLLVFGLLTGQILGRMGNFFNKELYGLPTDLPWGLYIEEKYRVSGYENFERFHPLFAYEMIFNLILLVILASGFSKKREIGYRLYIYCLGYGIIRFCLDFLRIDQWTLGLLGVSQWISLGMIITGIFGLKRVEDKMRRR